jgi:hypothetical protein
LFCAACTTPAAGEMRRRFDLMAPGACVAVIPRAHGSVDAAFSAARGHPDGVMPGPPGRDELRLP